MTTPHEAAWEAARLLMHQPPPRAPKWWMDKAEQVAKELYAVFGCPPDPVTSTGGNYYSLRNERP